jgi:hypothetical protein
MSFPAFLSNLLAYRSVNFFLPFDTSHPISRTQMDQLSLRQPPKD